MKEKTKCRCGRYFEKGKFYTSIRGKRMTLWAKKFCPSCTIRKKEKKIKDAAKLYHLLRILFHAH